MNHERPIRTLMISEELPAKDTSTLPFWLPKPAEISAAAVLGRFAPLPEHTLITSLGKQRINIC